MEEVQTQAQGQKKSRSFSVSEVTKQGWQLFKSRPLLLIGAVLISGIGGSITSSMNNSTADSQVGFFMIVTVNVLGFLVSSFLTLGLMKLVLDLVDKKETGIGTMFSGLRWLLDYVVVSIASAFVVIVGLILLIIPGIYLAIRFSYAGYFVIDKNLGAVAAMRASWDATKGNTLNVLFFGLLMIVINFIGLLALFVGIFITLPIAVAANAYVFRALVPREATPAASAPAPQQM